MDKKIAIRIHANETGSVLAAADAQLLGKTLNEGKISLNVSKTFYHEKMVDENELVEHLNEAGNINLIGEETVKVAVKQGIISQNSARRIAGVPHAQIYKI